MINEQMREAFAAQSVEVELDKELLPPSMYWFYSGWSAALSQSAPQGVAGMMHLVEKYASDTADFVPVGSPVSSCEPIEQAITALATERDTLRERVAELEKDAANWREWLPWLRRLKKLPFNLAKLIHAPDAAIAASKEAK